MAFTWAGCASPPPSSPTDQVADPSGGILLVDVTATSGLTGFRHITGASGRYWAPEAMGSGLAVLDYDLDGWLDLALINGASLPGYEGPPPRSALYRNLGNGAFADVTDAARFRVPTYGMGACAGDYDNDGFPDLYVTGVEQSHLFRNTGAGAFEDVTTRTGVANAGEWGAPCAWVDYDRDGWLDLFVGNFIVYSHARELDIRARHTDYMVSTYFPGFYDPAPVVLYRNRGDGTFENITAAAGLGGLRMRALGVAVFDHDDDGWPDLVVANDGGPDQLLRNRRDGTFEVIGQQVSLAYDLGGSPRSGMGIDTADIFNGRPECVAVSNFSTERLGLYERIGPDLYRDRAREAGVAAPTNPYVGWGLRFADFDLDGRLDFALVNGHIHDNVVNIGPGDSHAMPGFLFRNEGGGRFRDVTAAQAPCLGRPVVGRGLALVDYDNDGDPDVLITINGGSANAGGVRLFRNQRAGPERWVGFRLMVGDPPRDALGARITLTAAGVTQQRWVRSGSSYLCESDPRAFFGLGDARRIDRVVIRWPDGSQSELTNLDPNALFAVHANRGVVARLPAGLSWSSRSLVSTAP